MVDRINPAELQLNKANSSDTEAPFLDLNLSISNGTASTDDKRDDFDFDVVPRRRCPSTYVLWSVHISAYSFRLSIF